MRESAVIRASGQISQTWSVRAVWGQRATLGESDTNASAVVTADAVSKRRLRLGTEPSTRQWLKSWHACQGVNRCPIGLTIWN